MQIALITVLSIIGYIFVGGSLSGILHKKTDAHGEVYGTPIEIFVVFWPIVFAAVSIVYPVYYLYKFSYYCGKNLNKIFSFKFIKNSWQAQLSKKYKALEILIPKNVEITSSKQYRELSRLVRKYEERLPIGERE